MARSTKVVELGLEDVVVAARERGLSLEKIRDAANRALRGRGEKTTVSKPSIERYLATLDAASVAPAHAPQLAERNATLAIDFAGRLVELDGTVHRWLREADGAVTPMKGVLWDPVAQAPRDRRTAERNADSLRDEYLEAEAEPPEWTEPVVVLVPDWRARTSVAREMREVLELYANVMERVANAQAVEDFRRIIFEAIREADPDTARKIVDKLKDVRAARQAGMFGL